MTDESKLSNEARSTATGPRAGPPLIGVTGPNASGKGEAVAFLAGLGYARHSLSDIVREEAARRGLSHAREDLIRVGNALRASGGAGALAERLLPRLTGRDVVDSIRNPQEVAVLRRVAGFVLVGIDAPVEVRFERSRLRGRLGDGETLDLFRRREEEENSADPTRQQLRATLALSDHLVLNAGTLADFHAALARLLERP